VYASTHHALVLLAYFDDDEDLVEFVELLLECIEESIWETPVDEKEDEDLEDFLRAMKRISLILSLLK